MIKKRIGILTGGGDCPGLNAVIRAITKRAILELGMDVVGIEDGFEGLVDRRWRPLALDDVSGILTRGGTILGTTNKGDPFALGDRGDQSGTAVDNFRRLRLDALVCLGGDGTMKISHRLGRKGIPIVGVPKTIDNDVEGTHVTFGFDSAVRVATEAVDMLHTTADAHRRAMVVEVMGRDAGWIALYAGVAGGADVILMPELPYRRDRVAAYVQRRHQSRRFSILVTAEGAVSGAKVAAELQEDTGVESRVTVLGHLQRGGGPTATDRLLATRLGYAAVDLIRRRAFGRMAAVQGGQITSVPLAKIAGRVKRVPLDHDLIRAARAIGTSFGD